MSTKNVGAMLSIISPVYGCERCLEDLVDRIAAALSNRSEPFEVILVDDASPDGAWARITELAVGRPWLRGLRLSRNFGQHAAISAGLREARGDCVVVMDCDLQDRPEEIPALLAALGGGIEIALAQRVERRDSLPKRFSSWSFYKVLGWLTGVPYDHTTANFGAYTRKVIDIVNAMPEADRFFPLMIRWTGHRAAFVEVDHAQRGHGRSSYNARQLLKLALNVALSYSDKPLRMVVAMGLAFAGLALFVVVFSVYRYWLGDVQVAGFTGIVASVWLIGSAILSSVGILGLYLGRLFNDSKRRPHFVIAERTDRP
jgi:polyisoprenyl-phosphate glycosyltransferase